MHDKVLVRRIRSASNSSFKMVPSTSGRVGDEGNIDIGEYTSRHEVDPISVRTLGNDYVLVGKDELSGDFLKHGVKIYREYFDEEGDSSYYLIFDLEAEKLVRGIPDEISLEYFDGDESDDLEEGFFYYLAQFNYGFSLSFSNFVNGIMNRIKACRTQLNGKVCKVLSVCEALNLKWIYEDRDRRLTSEDIMKFYNYVELVNVGNGEAKNNPKKTKVGELPPLSSKVIVIEPAMAPGIQGSTDLKSVEANFYLPYA
ncbi:hypothetical protein GIB67_030883 [Kingdonia uniflora]|uniref:Uncharacterized protein n=1 Tax=Kingdonia uniflora TaxID=39325 RepID=A0A7J7L3G6_9MAGN|nr:hypothetical protein GIB67_030883 [Kingdonia uniflora]